jgi:XTP/dITP diphosphohydrolase
MKIAFVSKNSHKVSEVQLLLKDHPIEIVRLPFPVDELQTQDDRKLVKDKLIKAFKHCGIPVIVEHTSLHINHLNGFPSGLTEIFWEKLQHDKFASIIGGLPDNTLQAKTIIGYCDGKSVFFFEGQISGTVPNSPRGPKEFQWDSVFIPDGYDQTFAEMGTEEKNKISMRKIAYEKFTNHLIQSGRTN